MIVCLRQLQEKCIEQDRPLYTVFVDFSKAFDTFGRTELWQHSYWRNMAAQRSSQQWSRHYIPEWWRRGSFGQARLCTGLHALLHLPLSNARRGFPRHGGWHLLTVQTERWLIQRRTLQSEDQDYSDTDVRTAIRRWQCTGCTFCWRDAENSGCFLQCVKEVRLED